MTPYLALLSTLTGSNYPCLELIFMVPKVFEPLKFDCIFNNARFLHKHFSDIEFEPNILSADVIGFAESRLCARDDSSHFAQKDFKLLRIDETGHNSGNRPYHMLALYIMDYYEIQRIEKILLTHMNLCWLPCIAI